MAKIHLDLPLESKTRLVFPACFFHTFEWLNHIQSIWLNHHHFRLAQERSHFPSHFSTLLLASAGENPVAKAPVAEALGQICGGLGGHGQGTFARIHVAPGLENTTQTEPRVGYPICSMVLVFFWWTSQVGKKIVGIVINSISHSDWSLKTHDTSQLPWGVIKHGNGKYTIYRQFSIETSISGGFPVVGNMKYESHLLHGAGTLWCHQSNMASWKIPYKWRFQWDTHW